MTCFIQNTIIETNQTLMPQKEKKLLITKETDYALRILRSLADAGNTKTPIKEICDKELLPQQFVYKIAKKLAKAGIIELSRGVGGGCRLICDLHDISLLTLIAIMDADRPISACMQTNYHCPWREKYRQVCLVHTHLSHLQKEINEKLHSYSLYTILFDTHI